MNVIFNKVIAKDGQTAAERFAAMVKDPTTFYAVDNELYKGDVLLSANMAAEIGVADADGHFEGTDVEAVLAELFADAIDKTIWFHDDSAGQSDYAKVYHLYQGENDFVADREDGKQNPRLVGTINTPKDLVVKSGKVVPITWDETEEKLMDGEEDVTDLIVPIGETPSAEFAGKYVKLEIQNQDDPIYIAVKDLVDVYTGGTTAEATVAIDANNEITVTINKINATKIIYREAGYRQLTAADAYDSTATYYTYDGTDYTVDSTVNETNFADKVDAGLYVAVTEQHVKAKIDQVEADLNALADYVGEIPEASEAQTVIDYVDEKTGEGVGSLNSEAGVASVASNVVTIKGGIVETEGLIANSVATAPATEVQGYFNPADGKFYEESTFDTEITPADNTSYVDQAVGGKTYVWTGKKFAEVRPDIVLEEVAITGAAADVSIADAGSHFTGETVEAALQEIGAQLTWNEV